MALHSNSLALIALTTLGGSGVILTLVVVVACKRSWSAAFHAWPVLCGLYAASRDPQEVVGLKVVDLVEECVETVQKKKRKTC